MTPLQEFYELAGVEGVKAPEEEPEEGEEEPEEDGEGWVAVSTS